MLHRQHQRGRRSCRRRILQRLPLPPSAQDFPEGEWRFVQVSNVGIRPPLQQVERQQGVLPLDRLHQSTVSLPLLDLATYPKGRETDHQSGQEKRRQPEPDCTSAFHAWILTCMQSLVMVNGRGSSLIESMNADLCLFAG